jgi:hypothetical protein
MQHLGLFVILLLIAGLTFTVMAWKGGLHMTFSQHVARKRSSAVFYSLLFMTTLPLLMWFFTAWLVPVKKLPSEFLWFASVAVLFQILCTWVPEKGGRKTLIHRILTAISGISLIPLVAIIANTQSLSAATRNTAWLALFIMLLLLSIALRKQKGHRYALLLQIGYYAAFFIVILLTTYL